MAVKQVKKKKTGVVKKKTVLSKKTGGSSAVKKLNAIVAGEVQKALKNRIQNKKRKLTMDLSLVERLLSIDEHLCLYKQQVYCQLSLFILYSILERLLDFSSN